MSTLELFCEGEVRDKYAEAYARKLAPRYRVPRPNYALVHTKPRSVLDARGFRIAHKAWKFEGWTHDEDVAHAFAMFLETDKRAAHMPRGLAALVRLTPGHNAINEAYPVNEAHD